MSNDSSSNQAPIVPNVALATTNRRRRVLPVWKKSLFAVLFVTAIFAGLEFLLFVCGVRPAYLESDPYVGFQPGVPLFIQDGAEWRTNPVKLSFFNQQQFPVVKQPGEFRVFCLGGSTTFGHPYHDATSFSGWLREILQATAPERTWRVINCGGISYASYRVCLLMQELSRYEPDLFIVYDGHNEFLEQRTYGDLQNRNWIVVTANTVISQTRLGSAARRLVGASRPAGKQTRLAPEVDTILEHSIGPTEYRRDVKQREGVLRHFDHSLDRMCAIARAAGARIMFVKPASNLRHFTPFKSEHGPLSQSDAEQWERATRSAETAQREMRPEAADLYVEATKIDPQYALSHWHAGDALLARGDTALAREHFLKALDEDVCPLRATRPIQDAVERAARRNQVPMIDMPMILEQTLAGTDAKGIPGDESFLDHVHHTIEGNRLIALQLAHQMADWKLFKLPADPDLLTRDVTKKIMSQIDKKADALALVQVIQVLSWAGKNEEALRLSDTAEKTCPGLSEVVSYRGRLLQKMGRDDEAFECFAEAVRRNPHDSLAASRLGNAQLTRRQFAAARKELERAIQDTPDSAPVSFRAALRVSLGQTYLGLNRPKEAAAMFAEALELEPGMAEAERLLKAAQTRFPK